MNPANASAVFTIEELWLLQSVVRHELAQGDQWKFPPASLELNDQIADVIVLCEEHSLGEAALVLSRGDCLVIDYCTPQGARSVAGLPIGRNVLLKSFIARRVIEQGPAPTSEEPAQPTSGEVRETLRRMQGD